MSKFETNPFDRTALVNIDLLAGRANELKQIRFVLRNALRQKKRFRHLLITGKRGVGKTSFLNIIENESPTYNIIPIRINLTNNNSKNSHEFFWTLFNQTMRVFFKKRLFGGRNGPIDIAVNKILNTGSASDPADWVFKMPMERFNYAINKNLPFDFNSFIDDLECFMAELLESENEEFDENTKIVYLIDETQQLFENLQIVEEVRYIIQNQDIGVGFVFAGDHSYQTTTWEKVFGGSQREFEIMDLNYFSEPKAVEEYFSKSLESIGWTSTDIEENLFYRFKRACLDIYILTSGIPSWINVIAFKMFERCMKGETKELRFDKQAQEDVKDLLSKGGFIDSHIIDFINQIPTNYAKWLKIIFASELSTLDDVYFYGKFIISGNDVLYKEQFYSFCKILIEKKIIIPLSKINQNQNGNKAILDDLSNNIFNQQYIAFGEDADKLKQYLQITSKGNYRFVVDHPSFSFISQINTELVREGRKVTEAMASINKSENGLESVDHVIEKLNVKDLDVSEISNHKIHFYYKFFKRLERSRERQILHIRLKNMNSSNVRTWWLYNYDEHENIIGYDRLESKLEKFSANVKKHNSEEENYELDVQIINLTKPNLEYFQDLIIKTKDSKKIQIVIEDKHNELIKSYLKKNSLTEAYSISNFFNELFESGHDLDIQNLNNASYIFLLKNDLEVANGLLSEAKRKAKNKSFDKSELSTIPLIYYNYGILLSKKGKYNLAYHEFENAIDFITDHEIRDNKAGAMQQLKLNEQKEIIFTEIKEGASDTISILDCSRNNINVIDDFFEKTESV